MKLAVQWYPLYCVSLDVSSWYTVVSGIMANMFSFSILCLWVSQLKVVYCLAE